MNKLLGALLFFVYSNALSNNNHCSLHIITASKLKELSQNALQTKNLNSCKYYVLKSRIFYLYNVKNLKNCNCLKQKNIQFINFLRKAENSQSLKSCKKNINNFLNRLNITVDEIASCN